MFLNLLLLMTVVTIPYTTHSARKRISPPVSGARTAAVVYSAVMLANVVVPFAGLYAYIAHRPALLAAGVEPSRR